LVLLLEDERPGAFTSKPQICQKTGNPNWVGPGKKKDVKEGEKRKKEIKWVAKKSKSSRFGLFAKAVVF